MNTAILLMGGSGLRFGSALPKQFHRISGKKIYLYTLERFLETGLFNEIILVCHPDWIAEVQADLIPYQNSTLKVVAGGENRQASSCLGLLACAPTRAVVIHDAVRPFITKKILEAHIEALKIHQAVDTCIPSADTIVHTTSGTQIDAIPPRAHYMRGQTPQSFSYPLILQAHLQTSQTNASDDCQLILNQGKSVFIVPGDEHNIKITTELDLFIAEQLFRLKQSNPPSPSSVSLKGKRIAITGGTGGIGTAICALLEKEGAVPVVISRTAETFAADLTSQEKVQKLFETLGPLDGLINSVGLLKIKDLQTLSAGEIEEMIAVNLTSLIFSCKWAQVQPGGHIINIASSAYARGRKGYAIYSSAKAGVVNFSQALAEERPDLQVNVLVPQRTNTAMRHACFPEENVETLLPPEKVAESIINLLKQTNLTGSIITPPAIQKAPVSTHQR